MIKHCLPFNDTSTVSANFRNKILPLFCPANQTAVHPRDVPFGERAQDTNEEEATSRAKKQPQYSSGRPSSSSDLRNRRTSVLRSERTHVAHAHCPF
ncbi:hypothetical protein CEXT_330901 [Caerostris extrusa]|uniref:Uncharacterized protein n=1 Tax=Caerostris extrusa TaxID=172846 RepID=A0AAV4YD96_CAEEX|nr:hypothetical protein CEXT_330901 [Caerostris extrusa]